MGKAITLGLVLGASLAPGFSTVFKTAKERAQGLKSTLSQARLGAAAAADVAKLGARLESLKSSQTTLRGSNAKLTSDIKTTERALEKARETAGRYGITLENAATQQTHLAATADRAARSLARMQAKEQRKAVRDEAKGQILGTVGPALGAGAVVKTSMGFEHRLRGIGNIADLSGKQITTLGHAVQRTGYDVNQTSDSMLDAYNVLLGKGMDPSRANAVLGIIGKTATGEQANIEDLSVTTFALVDNLKLAESEMPKAMDILAQSGKEGSFELKDMAKYFPQLTAQAATLGMKGTEAVSTLGAALQVAMKGAGSPEEAATNLRNFLQKMTAPDTLKNFKKTFGVNLEASLKEAMQRGENPIEYMVELIAKLTKGDKFKVGKLFADQQVQNFLAPMMQHMEEFREIKKKSEQASGVVDRDFANMMGTATERVKHATTAFRWLGVSLGTTLLPAVGFVADKLATMASCVADLAQRYPHLTTVVVGAAVGLVGFKVAALSAKFAGTLLGGGLDTMVGTFKFFFPSVLRTNTALRATRTSSLAAALGVRGLNLALLASPVGLIAAGIAAGAFLIYKYWGPIKSFFTGLWEGLQVGLQPVMGQFEALGRAIEPVWKAAQKLWGVVSNFFTTQDQGESKTAESWGKRIGTVIGGTLVNMIPGASLVTSLFGASEGKKPAPSHVRALPAHGQSVPVPKQEPTVPQPLTVKPTVSKKPTSVAGIAQQRLTQPGWESPRHQALLRRHGAIPAATTSTAPRRQSRVADVAQQRLPQPGWESPRLQALLLRHGAIPTAIPPTSPVTTPRSVAVSQAPAKPVTDPQPLAKAGGQSRAGQVTNNISVTGVGMDTVQKIVKTALDAFTRDLESKLEAMRAQQMRVSYGG